MTSRGEAEDFRIRTGWLPQPSVVICADGCCSGAANGGVEAQPASAKRAAVKSAILMGLSSIKQYLFGRRSRSRAGRVRWSRRYLLHATCQKLVPRSSRPGRMRKNGSDGMTNQSVAFACLATRATSPPVSHQSQRMARIDTSGSEAIGPPKPATSGHPRRLPARNAGKGGFKDQIQHVIPPAMRRLLDLTGAWGLT